MSARVLVVDDHPLNVKVLEAKLASEYYEVITAADGLAAIKALHADRPDIVLLDVMMPGLDGFEVCRRMKGDPELWHIPVIMVTALTESSDRVRGLEAGADDFLTKPINDMALFARLRSLLRVKMMFDELRLRDETFFQLGGRDAPRLMSDPVADGRVLIVEDRDEVADIIDEELGGEHSVTRVTDGDAALAWLFEREADLVIVSLDLARTDGLRLCSQLRSREETRHLPMLMLVERDETERLVRGLDLGVNDYLYRPIDRHELVARTRSQLRRKRYQDRLRGTYRRTVSLAVTDALTGLYNRLYLTSHLEALLAKSLDDGKPLSAAMIDIDYFKRVNDTYGHDVGDAVLRELAGRLGRLLRASDLVARLGGEEFVAVMPDTDMATAAAVTQRIREEVAKAPFAGDLVEGGIEVTVSIGVAAFTGARDTPAALLKRADKALYAAKEGGRNQVVAASA